MSMGAQADREGGWVGRVSSSMHFLRGIVGAGSASKWQYLIAAFTQTGDWPLTKQAATMWKKV